MKRSLYLIYFELDPFDCKKINGKATFQIFAELFAKSLSY